jgi:hypothetical protein
MPSTTRYADGQWNFTCEMCGATRKSGESTLTWDNRRVCKRHREVRNPLDLQRAPRPEQAIPWSSPRPPDHFVQSSFRLLQEDGSQLVLDDLFSVLLRT